MVHRFCTYVWQFYDGKPDNLDIFICQEIHYHRFVSTRYICWALGVVWKTVVFLNTYHQLLIYYK